MGKVKSPGPKTRGQLFVDKFSVGCKCHDHDAFKNILIPIDRTKPQAMHDFSI